MVDKYSGPYKVLERANKAWKVQVGERWRSSAGTASSRTRAVWILWQPGRPHVGG